MTADGANAADPGWARREEAQAAAYDRIGDRYDAAFPHKEGQIGSGAWVLDRLPRGARVLDAGCGTGLPTLRQFVDGGCAVTGTDISPGMCALARSNVPEATIVRRDILDLETQDTYDAVVAFFSLLHFPRTLMPEALAAIGRALRPGGLFSLAMVEADVDDEPIPFLGQEIRVTGYFRDDLRELLEQAGFAVERERALSYAPASTQAQPEIQLFLDCRHVG